MVTATVLPQAMTNKHFLHTMGNNRLGAFQRPPSYRRLLHQNSGECGEPLKDLWWTVREAQGALKKVSKREFNHFFTFWRFLVTFSDASVTFFVGVANWTPFAKLSGFNDAMQNAAFFERK